MLKLNLDVAFSRLPNGLGSVFLSFPFGAARLSFRASIDNILEHEQAGCPDTIGFDVVDVFVI